MKTTLCEPTTNTALISRSAIQEYYGKVLSRTEDLQTNACCTSGGMPPHLSEIAQLIAPEVIEKFYGCGSPIPPAVDGCTVLDLGCGSGRDVFFCSKLVGESGRVIGVDMTQEQLAVARRHADEQARRFGFRHPNTIFYHGYIEDLVALGITDESVDVVISNCVINLSPYKEQVFREIMRVLKPGGELLFSDVFADRRLDPALQRDPVLVGECLAGALYWEDFRRLMQRLGVPDVRVLEQSPFTVDNPAIAARFGGAQFRSVTVRAFKIAGLEDRCEDYGQVAVYTGGILGAPHLFRLDDHHVFEEARPLRVCGNTAAMLQDTRLARFFHVTGDRSRHFGLFPCESAPVSVVVPPGRGCC
ncbi:MAG: methyltransferase domain-containing protein [Candidatus Sumerlaeia bacterium]